MKKVLEKEDNMGEILFPTELEFQKAGPRNLRKKTVKSSSSVSVLWSISFQLPAFLIDKSKGLGGMMELPITWKQLSLPDASCDLAPLSIVLARPFVSDTLCLQFQLKATSD